MPGENSFGIPYPLDSDPIADWPDIMVSLAQALAAKLPQKGTTTLTVGTWGGDGNWWDLGALAFPVPFGEVPVIITKFVTAYSGAPIVDVQAHTITTTGCLLRGKCTDSKVNGTVRWIGLAG